MRTSIATVIAAMTLGAPAAQAEVVLATDQYSMVGATGRCVATGVSPGVVSVTVQGESLHTWTAVECRVFESTTFSCDRYVGSVARKLPGVTAAASGVFKLTGGEVCLSMWVSGGLPVR